MNRGFLLPILLVSLVVIGIRSCVCQNEYETCRQPFQCGSLTNLNYPFHGGNRSASCGYPGFDLSCQDDGVALINTSSIIYRLLSYDNQTQTITVARNDLWTEPCTQLLRNTTVDPARYSFSSSANDQEISLLYGCTGQILVPLPNQFDCNGLSFFFSGGVTLSNSVTCAGPEITVRVTQNAAAALAVNASQTLLQTSLRSGFSVEWSADNDRCRSCVGSGGTCGSDQSSGSFACYCVNGGSRFESTCTIATGGNSNSSNLGMNIGVFIGGAVLAGVGLGWLIFYCRQKRKQRLKTLATESTQSASKEIICYFAIPYISTYLEKKSNPDVQQFLVNHGSLAQKRYSYFEIKKITKSFKDKLGQGGFGTVYKGNLPDGQPVAVKVLTQSRDDKDAEDFINEVASISRTSHVNIVNLLGFCYGRKKTALVYEFMPNKSLDSYIKNADMSLEWNKLFEIAVGVARGLEYLHRGCNTRIVHFDIKPQNILLGEDFSPKISDFGLAKLCMKKESKISMLGMRGTIGYIAPEVFSRNFGVVSYKSDVYSYGMMLLEMAEARKVVEIEHNTQSSESYFPDNIYEHVLLRNEKMDDLHVRDEKEESEIKMLMVGIWCIQTAPSDRPSMSKVLEMLEGSLQSIQMPPKPFFPLQSGAVEFSSSVNMDSENSI